jgi:hypothetical protein
MNESYKQFPGKQSLGMSTATIDRGQTRETRAPAVKPLFNEIVRKLQIEKAG